jgi:hypothetical protein
VNNFIKIPLLVSVLSLGVAAGCSSDGDDAKPDNGMVGGMATCDSESLLAAANAGAPSGITYELSLQGDAGFTCADGWAVMFPDEVDASDPDTPITVTLVFEAEGQFWIPKDRMDVCGTYDESDPNKRPDDAQVPAAIFDQACRTN